MKTQKGSGLMSVLIIIVFVMVLLFVFLKKPVATYAPTEGVDANESILELSGDMVDGVRELKDTLESRNDVANSRFE